MERNHFKHFGFNMGFTDKTGVEHPEAFWKVGNLQMDTDRKEISFILTAWHSIEAFNAGDNSLVNVGGQRPYSFSSFGSDNIIKKYAVEVGGVASALKEIAQSVIDTPDAQGVFKSFFDGAGEIIVPPELEAAFKK